MKNILNNIKFYSLLSMCWFMVVWLVGVGTDNVKLAEVGGVIVVVSFVIVLGSCAGIKLFNDVSKDKRKRKRSKIKACIFNLYLYT
tara:strand:- start:7406 stop:7663 length:258 start_codon:yes stop_codon:yes gene_type:complete